jgi:hypothetical protein
MKKEQRIVESFEDFQNPEAAPVENKISPEAKERMESFADAENLTALVDSVRLFASEMMNDGFEKEDVMEYIESIID